MGCVGWCVGVVWCVGWCGVGWFGMHSLKMPSIVAKE